MSTNIISATVHVALGQRHRFSIAAFAESTADESVTRDRLMSALDTQLNEELSYLVSGENVDKHMFNATFSSAFRAALSSKEDLYYLQRVENKFMIATNNSKLHKTINSLYIRLTGTSINFLKK